MIYFRRLLICALASLLVHFLVARGAEELPGLPTFVPVRSVTVHVIEPPPPEPEKPPPAIEPPVAPKPRTLAVRPPPHAPKPTDVATERPPDAPTPMAPPQFGVSMESTSQAGSGPAVAVGNTLQTPGTGARAPAAAPAAAVVEAYQVTRMPEPKGRCEGRYTDEAHQAGLEGTVVLDVVVGEDGRTRDVAVVSGLGHGLTEAAVAALKQCRFAPGERDGKPVAVRVRAFKIRFVLPQND